MLYSLTQHSCWNRKGYPFLHCKYQRGEPTSNPEHKCSSMNNEEYKTCWDKSLRRWNYKQSKGGYLEASHRPEEMPLHSIRFDTMYLKMAITRRFMTYLRSFILKRLSHQIKSFSENVLLSFWGNFHVYC